MADIVEKKLPINDEGSKPVRSHSHFKPFYDLAQTVRYGELTPFFVMDSVPDDDIDLNLRNIVRTFTLKAPLMQGVNMKKDLFLVPLSAIIPNNYEKFITTPNVGEDINSSLVGTSCDNFFARLSPIFKSVCSEVYDHIDTSDISDAKTAFMIVSKFIICLDTIYSSGSLLNNLGCHTCQDPAVVDNLIDSWWSLVQSWITDYGIVINVSQGGSTFKIGSSSSAYDENISLREGISRLRDESFAISSITFGTSTDSAILSAISQFCLENVNVLDSGVLNSSSLPLDLARLYAYQIVCAHFYSNDHVDYIYTAELWRQNLKSYFLDNPYLGDVAVNTPFTINGAKYYYDVCSGYYVNMILGLYGDIVFASDWISNFYDWIRLVFGYNRSLRFGDYFTSSRTQPLAAVGVNDTGVSVVNNSVDIVESIQKRWYIKLWSQVSRVGRRLADQMKGLFPNAQSSFDWHEPLWLDSSDSFVHSEEVENTGSDQLTKQNSITSTLNCDSDVTRLHISINDRYGIIIGITSFDVRRFYAHTIERPFFHVSRYDKFNPYLQFMGDQKVYRGELWNGLGDNAFGYQGRYMEYKQRFDQATGGFINGSLPGYLFLADVNRNSSLVNIGPNYIRSYPSELDNFYVSLTGYSLGSYFHFIIINKNVVESNRAMAYNPQID